MISNPKSLQAKQILGRELSADLPVVIDSFFLRKISGAIDPEYEAKPSVHCHLLRDSNSRVKKKVRAWHTIGIPLLSLIFS